ncbi:MAG: XRE family transcriptional regulator [Bacteroidales bacterium]|nr:XRE family transcriptional regulator [Bacteroidales bacterium]
MATHEPLHIGHLIKGELARQGRSVAWLATQIGYTRQNTYHLLGRSFIYTDLLLKISDLLDFDFFKCYSDYRNEKRLSNNI